MVGKLQNYNLWVIYLIRTTIFMKRNQKCFHKIFHEYHRFTKCFLPIPYINKKYSVRNFSFSFFLLFLFLRTVSLCRLGYPGTHSDTPASVFYILGLKCTATTAQLRKVLKPEYSHFEQNISSDSIFIISFYLIISKTFSLFQVLV